MRLTQGDVKRISGEFALENVTRFVCVNKKYDDVTILSQCPNLFYVNLTNSCVSSLSFVRGLKSLQVLIMNGNNISSIADLSTVDSEGASVCKVETLALANNKIQNIQELGHLSGLSCLRTLTLTGNPVCENPDFMRSALAANAGVLTINHTRVRTLGGLLCNLDAYIVEEKKVVIPDDTKVEPIPWLPDSAFELTGFPDFDSFAGDLVSKLRSKIQEYNKLKSDMILELAPRQ